MPSCSFRGCLLWGSLIRLCSIYYICFYVYPFCNSFLSVVKVSVKTAQPCCTARDCKGHGLIDLVSSCSVFAMKQLKGIRICVNHFCSRVTSALQFQPPGPLFPPYSGGRWLILILNLLINQSSCNKLNDLCHCVPPPHVANRSKFMAYYGKSTLTVWRFRGPI